jgi:hypothetical protein
MIDKFEVVHIEDDSDYKTVIKGILQFSGIEKYNSLSSLDELKTFFKEKNSSRVYVVDGNIPMRSGETNQCLYKETVSEIKKNDPLAVIILHSGEMISEPACIVVPKGESNDLVSIISKSLNNDFFLRKAYKSIK